MLYPFSSIPLNPSYIVTSFGFNNMNNQERINIFLIFAIRHSARLNICRINFQLWNKSGFNVLHLAVLINDSKYYFNLFRFKEYVSIFLYL